MIVVFSGHTHLLFLIGKFMMMIALFKKFLSQQFIASVEVNNIARCSSKMNELRYIDERCKV